MKIHKILNNNVVVLLDEEGKERIVMGRGIGFSAKPGEKVNPEAIEKTFARNDQNEVEYSRRNVDRYLFIAEAIIEKAKISLGEPLNKNLYLALSEYLLQAIEQGKKGINKTNMLKSDIEKYYPDEYAIGLYGIDLIEKELKVKLEEDVASYIALYLYRGQLDSCTYDSSEIPEIIQEIFNIVGNFFNIRISKESLCSSDFRRYLNYLTSKALTLKGRVSEEKDDETLHSLISKEKPEIYECVVEIGDYLFKGYHYKPE